MTVRSRFVVCFVITALVFNTAVAQEQIDACRGEAIGWVDDNENMLDEAAKTIWEFAEIAWKEHKSSKLLADMLEKDGFSVERGVADMPTAFVATYGSGKPVVGILAEYDALPGLSQKADSIVKEPLVEGVSGHGCGHNIFGVASTGAAMAVKSVMEKNKLSGTVKLFGCPSEEILAGKVYMAKAGVFDGLDICFGWHPRGQNLVESGSSLAMNNFEVTFHGKTAHGASDPWEGRSALDAVELMNIGVNFLREHMKPTARIHYMIADGGKAPNIVPDYAKVWYFVRDEDRAGVEHLYERVLNIAKGAALMTDTTYEVYLTTGVYELMLNKALSEVLFRNLELAGPPQFTQAEQEFAKQLQRAFGKEEVGLMTEIEEIQPAGGGSTDMGDVSWLVPTASMGTVCWPKDIPGHTWGIVTCSGSSIGLKGMRATAKVIAAAGVEVLLDKSIVEKAQAEFKEKTKDFVYKCAVPKDQKPPIPVCGK